MIGGIEYAPQMDSMDSPKQNALDEEDSFIGEHVASDPPLPDGRNEECSPYERDRGSGLTQIEASIVPGSKAGRESKPQGGEPEGNS